MNVDQETWVPNERPSEDGSAEGLEIPWQNLEAETLSRLIRECILREGFDVGDEESLARTGAKVLAQLRNGSLRLLYDQRTESVQIGP